MFHVIKKELKLASFTQLGFPVEHVEQSASAWFVHYFSHLHLFLSLCFDFHIGQ